MDVIVIRHGQSTNNALMENQHLRVQDPALTDMGKKQAERVADYLANCPDLEQLVRTPVNSPERDSVPTYPITHLYCSPMHRTLQTAYPIAQALGLKPEIWVEIHEHGGLFLEENGKDTGHPGLTRSQILADFPDYQVPETITDEGWWKPANGRESLELCTARALSVTRMLKTRAAREESKHDRIALVTHGMFMDQLIKALLSLLPGDRQYFFHYNTAITRFEIGTDGYVYLHCMNRTHHLPPELIT